MSANPERPPRLLTLLAASLLAFASGAATPAYALWPLAEGELFLSLDGSIAADSNISSNSLEISDTVYTVTPGFTWKRSRGRGSVSLSANCAIERASDYSSYDSENYTGKFDLSLPATGSGRLQGTLNLGYFNGSRVDPYLNTRISEETYDGGLNGSYQVSSKVSGRLGLNYSKTTPENVADYTSSVLNLGFGYKVRPAVSTYFDVRLSRSSSGFSNELNSDTKTNGRAFLFGVDGELTSKLSGHAGIGYDWSETELDGPDEKSDGFTYDVSLSWAPRDKTTVSLSASNGVQSTTIGSTKFANISLEGSQQIGIRTTASLSFHYRTTDFAAEGRGGDDVFETSAGLTYAFIRGVTISGRYTYTNSDSTNAIVNYERTVWTLMLSAYF